KTRVDLHVLSILSAFILSQDQTLRSMFLSFIVLIFYTLFVLFACCLFLFRFQGSEVCNSYRQSV
ncbi:MAG: hypothetical protein SPH94_00555, partial [Fusobacterium necrophorum]|nr:hypothetical protein [Fusobacterium necrophorum]